MFKRGYVVCLLFMALQATASESAFAQPDAGTTGSRVAAPDAAPISPQSVAPSVAPLAPPATAPAADVVAPSPATPPPVPAATAHVQQPRAQHAPIAVALIVDQLAAWVLRERIDRLPPDGGFARLRHEGKYVQEMAFAHAITETAPGHASLFTGRTPREHGIVANDVLGPDGKKHAIVAATKKAVEMVGLDRSPVAIEGSSLEALEGRSNLVGAVFRSRYPKGRGIIAALSLKDRGALFAAGEDADYVLWFDPELGGEASGHKARGAFVVPKRYEAALQRSGLDDFLGTYLVTDPDDRRDGLARIEERPWQGLDQAWLNKNTGAPGESDYTGFVGAHTASQAVKPGEAFRALPDSDRLLLEMALRILKTESKDMPVFLTVSLSANDYIGHLFGPDSWEGWDELRRLDATLAWFFKELDVYGSASWSVVLTADHGTVPPEDDAKRPVCGANPRPALDTGKPCSGASARAARIRLLDLKIEAENAAAGAGLRDTSGAKLDEVVAGVVYPYIYLTEAAKAATRGDAPARRRLARRLDNELGRKFKSVHAIMDVSQFKEDAICPDERGDRLAALVCNSVSPAPDRGGDFYIVLRPGAFFDPDMVEGKGVSHGSPYGYDRFVPLLVRDPSRPELAGQVEEKRVAFTQFRDEMVRIILSAPSFAR